ncbi:hypothetical protein ACLBYG_21830 [Methylobacterium sp. D53M]
MTPAPDTGRTAEEIRLKEQIAYTMAMRTALRPSLVEGLAEWQRVGYSSPEQDARANAWKWYGAADALLAGPLASILAEIAQLRSRLLQAEKGAKAWKRVAVIAAIPLEAMRMAGSYRALAPTTQTCVDEAVVTIRMAIAGHSLPPDGDLDAGLAPARAALNPNQEAGDADVL